MILLFTVIISILILSLDISRVIDLASKSGFVISGLFLPHSVLVSYVVFKSELCSIPIFILSVMVLFVLYSYFFWRVHIFPFRGKKTDSKKVNIMYGGRNLLIYGFWAFLINALLYIIFIRGIFDFCSEPANLIVFICDLAFAFWTIYGLMLNGILRVLILNRELGIYKRIIILLISWIPLINILGLKLLIVKAGDEYDYEMYRMSINNTRINSDICKTKYPIIMVHGIGFKDLKWFNYWGRIPAELQKNGATVRYGQQEPWGTIASNAEELNKNILELLKDTNSDKVNIIAHSKGGLESRFVIDEYNLGDHVASLTTICTPHRGSELIPFLRKLPDGVYRLICRIMDRFNTLNGDVSSDVYHASLELHPDFCDEFNQKHQNLPGIYYQSYASTMKTMWGNSILSIPYAVLKAVASPVNDGLVCETSAVWGDYRGLIAPKGLKGISHGDMIDLQRKDIKGFDVVETYINIVSELKNKGY